MPLRKPRNNVLYIFLCVFFLNSIEKEKKITLAS